MKPSSNLDAVLNFSHLNLRREKAGEDEGPIAADVKLTGEVGVDALKGLFSTKNSFDTVMGQLWTKNGELACGDVQKIDLTGELSGCSVTLKAGDGADEEDFESGELNKIRIKPLAGKVCEVTARLQLHPSNEQIAWLGGHYGYDLRVTVAKRQGNLDLTHGAGASASSATH